MSARVSALTVPPWHDAAALCVCILVHIQLRLKATMTWLCVAARTVLQGENEAGRQMNAMNISTPFMWGVWTTEPAAGTKMLAV